CKTLVGKAQTARMNLFYLSTHGGGLDTNVRVLAPALVEAGHRVTVLYIHFPGDSQAAQVSPIDGCQIMYVTTGALHYYLQRVTLGTTHLPRLLRSLEHTWALKRAVESMGVTPDLIELPEVFATPSLLSHIPYVVRLHSTAWTWRRMLHEPSGSADAIEI